MNLSGLIGWDDFLIKNTSGEIFSVPTIPLLARYIEPLNFQQLTLEADENYKGKIKWYIKPLVFGGDPGADNNLAWLTHEDHVKAVKWWNKKYIESVNDITEQKRLTKTGYYLAESAF